MNPEEEQNLRQELYQLCQSAIGFGGITSCGTTNPGSEKPWYIERHGKYIYLTLEEAQQYLKNLTKEDIPPGKLWDLIDGPQG